MFFHVLVGSSPIVVTNIALFADWILILWQKMVQTYRYNSECRWCFWTGDKPKKQMLDGSPVVRMKLDQLLYQFIPPRQVIPTRSLNSSTKVLPTIHYNPTTTPYVVGQTFPWFRTTFHRLNFPTVKNIYSIQTRHKQPAIN